MTAREIDAAIAEKVIGWKFSSQCQCQCHYPPGLHPAQNILGHVIPHYSTSIADAWSVVEKVGIVAIIKMENGEWMARFDEAAEAESYYERRTYKDKHANGYAFAETAPMCICFAALKSVGAI